MQVKGKNMETTKTKNRDTNFELLRIVNINIYIEHI